MRLAIAALALLSSPVVAQNASVSAAICEAVAVPLAAFSAVDLGPVSTTSDGWCQVIDQPLTNDVAARFVADQIDWHLRDAERWTDAQLPPTAIDLRVKNIHFVPITGDAVMDYLLGLQMSGQGIDVSARLDWTSEGGRLTLEHLYVDLPGASEITLTAHAHGIDLTNRATIESSLAGVRLTDLTLDVVADGLVEQYLLLSLGPILLRGEANPARAFAIQKAHASAAVADIPEALLVEQSKAAAMALIDAMPTPRGHLRVDYANTDGLASARIAPVMLGVVQLRGLTDALELLGENTLNISWTPADHQ